MSAWKVVSLDLRTIEPSPPAFMAELGRALGLPTEALCRGRRSPTANLRCCCWTRSRLRWGSRTGCGSSSSRRCRPVRWSWWRAGTVPGRRGGGIRGGATSCVWFPCATSGRTRRGPSCVARASRRSNRGGCSRVSHGHPLALALLVEVLLQRQAESQAGPLELGAAPDVVGRLVESFLAGVPGPRHRLALDCAAHARLTTEGPPRQHLWGRRGRRVVLVAAGPVVHGARNVRPVSARPRARGDRRGPALARPGRLSGGPPAGASTHRRAGLGQRGSRARACARGSDLLASGKPGGRGPVGLEEPGGGVRGPAAGRRR